MCICPRVSLLTARSLCLGSLDTLFPKLALQPDEVFIKHLGRRSQVSTNVLCIEGSLGWEQLHPLEDMVGLNLNSCSLLPVLLSLFPVAASAAAVAAWLRPLGPAEGTRDTAGTQPCVGSWGQEQPGSSCGGTGALLRRVTA